MDKEFDLFDFAEMNETPENSPQKNLPGKNELKQAAFAFLLSKNPCAIAANVPTRRSKYKASAAAFWRPEHSRKNSEITKTAIVMMYDDADYCFSDCAGREERISCIKTLQEQKELEEQLIRIEEPHLAASDDLFNEFRSWDYASSKNSKYKKICRKLKKELNLLTQGSKLEYIRRAGNADLCYLAIPAGLVDPSMIPVEWGIVELFPQGKNFRIVREAEKLENVTPTGRFQLALNIACAATPAVRFASGVDADGKLRRIPRRRGVLFSKKITE